jgi:hypothetical protein
MGNLLGQKWDFHRSGSPKTADFLRASRVPGRARGIQAARWTDVRGTAAIGGHPIPAAPVPIRIGPFFVALAGDVMHAVSPTDP